MDSPSERLAWSQGGFHSSDDRDLLLTSGISGSSVSSKDGGLSALANMELQDSDEDHNKILLSRENSLLSDEMGCENLIILKKVIPTWTEIESGKPVAIAPPPEFQDVPPNFKVKIWIEKFAQQLVSVLMTEALVASSQITWAIECSQDCHPSTESIKGRRRDSGPRLCWTPELPFSPGHHRPASRGSLASSRLSISHNSLTVPCCKADDSSFITLAMSHDVLIGELTASEISDIYNVPFDSDIYAVPIDMVRPTENITKINTGPLRPKRKPHRKKRRHVSSSSETERPSITPSRQLLSMTSRKTGGRCSTIRGSAETLESSKRHSVPGTYTSKRPGPSRSSTECSTSREPIHMTLQEVRQYLQNLYSSSSDSSEKKIEPIPPSTPRSRPSSEPKMPVVPPPPPPAILPSAQGSNNSRRPKKSTFITNMKNKKTKDTDSKSNEEKGRKCNSFSASLKQTLCSIFRFRKINSPEHQAVQSKVIEEPPSPSGGLPELLANGCALAPSSPDTARPPFSRRALPPLPAASPAPGGEGDGEEVEALLPSVEGEEAAGEPVEELSMDFASSIEKVKDYGWYWGPISGEAAEKILSSEPDGSFIVRDSSDHHYIFSLTFRLNGCVRHVRIEHDQGNFSFGSCTKFKSHTIVDFIENAVEHSRSGRYLFFLHRRPVLGPMRVQLLHPVSRFKQVQSLQHMCRFVILKLVRRDMIPSLPLPRRVIDYLSTPHYYAEQQLEDATLSSAASSSAGSSTDLLSFVPHRPRS